MLQIIHSGYVVTNVIPRLVRGIQKNNFWIARFIFVFIVSCVFFPTAGYGLGLEVDPVEIVVKDCPVGEKIAVSDLGGDEMKLRIENTGAAACTYTINTLFSSEAGSRLRQSYEDIPDTSWIMPQHKKVQIPAKATKAVELYLEIPEKEQYYNKKYQAVIEVKSKKDRPEDIFVLAVQIKMLFSTIKTEAQNENE
ncbi:MAG: hypothetical protein U9R31_01940 [Candidatus Omnitrophota bacterium]|nr:hypothetical protein [Candidatus Omnitrophota bacterium]